MDNKELRKVLRSDKEKIKVPNKFKPENISVILDNAKNTGVSGDVRSASKRRIPRVARRIIAGVSVAAIIALLMITVPILTKQMILTGYYNQMDNGFKQLTSYGKLQRYLEYVESITSENVESMQGITLGGASKGHEYYDTNVRTEGVNESDCVKTDGEYIYAYSYDKLSIIKPDGDTTRIVAEYWLHDWIKTNELDAELMLHENKLILVGDYEVSNFYYTMVVVLDIGDVDKISLIDSFSMEGYYKDCRMYGDYLYVSTAYYFYDRNVDEFIPQIEGKQMDCSKLYLTDSDDYEEYYTMTSFDMGDEPKLLDYTSVINDGDVEMYMSKENIYLLSERHTGYNKYFTEILKFSFEKGYFEAKSAIKLDGWIADIFCVDEYNGYLRLVITSYENLESNDILKTRKINSLFVLDGMLNVTGKITDIAPNEIVYSARFEGDMGYFVTYRTIDPLFSVDLSNPYEPKIIGELKVPGFSEYMHMWGDENILGIGRSDDYISLKLSMFDRSNPKNVTEEANLVFEEVWHSTALYNHRALLVDYDKNMIGFDMCAYMDISDVSTYYFGYYIYSYENKEFVRKVCIRYEEGADDMYYDKVRGMYIGDYIYVVVANGHTDVFDINTYENICTIEKL